MAVAGNTFSMIDDVDGKGVAPWSIGADTRAERIVEPDKAVAVDADAGDVRATVRWRIWAARRRHSKLRYAVMRARGGISDHQFADIAVKALRPPDIARVIVGNQVRGRTAASRIGEVFFD